MTERYQPSDASVALEVLLGRAVRWLRDYPQFYPEPTYELFLERWGGYFGWSAQQLLDAERVANLLAPENDPHDHEVIYDCTRLLGLTPPSDRTS